MIVNGFEINGAILGKWRELGADQSGLGLPVSNRHSDGRADKFHYQHFQNGIIVQIVRPEGELGAFAIWGDIYKRWVALGGLDFGLPITDEVPMPDGAGRYNEFLAWDPARTKQLIVWSGATGAWELVFDFRQRWEEAGASLGLLGYPTSGRDDFEGGRTQAFVGGALTWHPAIGSFLLTGPIGTRYNALGRHAFGYPTTAPAPISTELSLLHLARGNNPGVQDASIIWTPEFGAHGISGEIRRHWMTYGIIDIPPYIKNPLGYPAGEAVVAGDGVGASQRFAKGEVVWHPDLGAFGVRDPIALHWRSLGAEAAGYPYTEQIKRRGGAVMTHFRAMHLPDRPDWTIIHHEETGPHALHGAIRAKFMIWNVMYEAAPILLDLYGLPLDEEGPCFDGIGRAQSFQTGTMCWHPETPESAAFFVHGKTEIAWMQLGRESWAYPITDRTGCPDGVGSFQHFRAMHLPDRPEYSIYWSDTTEPFPVVGEIRRRWAQRGWERSNLGYPTSAEYPEATPGMVSAQNFQFGRIVVFADIGAIFDPITFSANMESGGLAAFGGRMNISVYADCSIRWHGHGRSSGLDNYSYSASASLRAPPGGDLVFAFSHQGDVYGTLTPGDRQNNWDSHAPAPLLFHDMLPSFYDIGMESESDYASGIAGALKDTVGFVVKFYLGAAATMAGGGLGLGLILMGTAGAAVVGAATGGSWQGGLRMAGGILWMAGPAGTLVSLGATGLARIGSRETVPPKSMYDWANETVFANTLPPRESIVITDTVGASNRAFVFPRFDGKITINLAPEDYIGVMNVGRWEDALVAHPELAKTVIHELVHCCQAARWGHQRFLSSALGIGYFQVTGNPYEYELGGDFRSYNLEQQGKIVEDCFAGELRPDGEPLYVSMDPDNPRYPLIVQMRAQEY